MSPFINFLFKRKEQHMKEMVGRFFQDETGASAVEYGLLVALIAVALIGTITLLSGGMKNTFTKATTQLNK